MFEEVDISNMEEDKTYESCPYCGYKEPTKPYTVNKKKYPFSANAQRMNAEYQRCNYGIQVLWNEIHCCKKCKKEYYTIHEH